MKQLIQSLRSGQVELIEVPKPSAAPGHVLIQTHASIISKGTEETLLEFGRASWLKKAKLQPDKVGQIKAKLKTDGWNATLASVRAKLDKPITPGYSQSGIIVAVGTGVSGLSVGDRVVSNGPHAEFVCVPHQLCVKIPSSRVISFEEAAFTPIASIALQSVRLLNPTLGEFIVVQGLGVIGLITVQLLKAHGCQVLGIDYDGFRLDLAKQFGAEVVSLNQVPNPVSRAIDFSKGNGVDGVIISASTASSEPIHFAAQMSRQRGKIVMVGSTGTQLSRDDFYKKELSFQVSCSYGPGRYQKNYEQKGLDYPIGFVRWTEKRNMEAILALLHEKKLNLNPLVSHRFPFSSSTEAYELLASKKTSTAIALSYPVACNQLIKETPRHFFSVNQPSQNSNLGLIGAGDHLSQQLLPMLKNLKVRPAAICSRSGVSAALLARKYQIPKIISSASEIIDSPNIDTVLIATQHDSHAMLVKKAILANKHIFVEKPLAISTSDLDEIENTITNTRFSKTLWVGFNRRFSPLSQRLKTLLDGTTGPKQMVYTVNALPLAENHWTQDGLTGGGRLVSELGHFIDLLRFLAGTPIVKYSVSRIDSELLDQCNSLTVCFSFQDGSLGVLNYSTLGSKTYPKEKIEVFVDSKVATLENFKKLSGYGFKGFNKMSLWNQDKGHRDCLSQFLKARNESAFDFQRWSEILEISRIACQLQSFDSPDRVLTTNVA